MGWLELLPLLRRMLPLLDRLMPMLEATLAGRAAARAEADRSSAAAPEIARDLEILLQSVEGQRAQTLALSEEIKRLRMSHEVVAARLEANEAQLARMVGWVKAGAILTPALLIAACLLLVLLAHRNA